MPTVHTTQTAFSPQLPLDLFRAQMSLWTRTGELLQENRARWLALAEHSLARDAGEAHAETQETAGVADWGDLASLPMNTAWRLLGQTVSNAQDVALTAINNQTAFAAGWQRALGEWQRETAQAMTQARNAMPISAVLAELMKGLPQVGPADGSDQTVRR